jgi:LTXXQ motif family protein
MFRWVTSGGRFRAIVGVLSVTLVAASSQSGLAGRQQDAGPRVLLTQARPTAPPPPNVEANISGLHQKLQITAAQEAQFNTVANVMRDNARSEASAPQRPAANATAVDDLRVYIQYGELELAGLKKLLPALDALYSTLSPAQKKTADAIFRQGPGG